MQETWVLSLGQEDPLEKGMVIHSSVLPSDKEPACQCSRCRRWELDRWVGKISWRREWQPNQYSCLENPMDRGAWRATVCGVAKSRTWLSMCVHVHTHAHTHTHTCTLTLQYSCQENFMDRGAWQAMIHGVAKSQTWLGDYQTNKQNLISFPDGCYP